MCEAVVAAMAAGGRKEPLRFLSAATWSRLSDEEDDTAVAREELRAFTLRLTAALEPLLDRNARVHVLSSEVWANRNSSATGNVVAAGDETELLQRLEAAAGGRSVAVGRGTTLSPNFQVLSLSGEAISVEHVYFESSGLRDWKYLRSREEQGADGAAFNRADLIQTVKTVLLEIPITYSIMIGSFLMIFVPSESVACTHVRGDCSSGQKLGLDRPFPCYVLAMNALTAAVFVLSNYVVAKREMWMIEYLDQDDEFPKTHLKTVIDRYPHIKHNLDMLNSACMHLSLTCMMLVLINFISSAVYVLNKTFSTDTTCCPDIAHKSVKTVTTLITNTLLVMLKLIREVNTSRASKVNTMGISAMHLLPFSYNTIDHDHLGDDGIPPNHEGSVIPGANALKSVSVRINALRRQIKVGRRGDKGGMIETLNTLSAMTIE